RQYDRSADHRHEDNHAERRRQCENPILEHGKFQYRLFETVLAPDENVQCHRTDNERYDDCRAQPSAVAGHTESVEQSAETECRQYNRDYIELRIRLFSDMPEDEIGDDQVDDDNRNQHIEEPAPWIDVHEPA